MEGDGNGRHSIKLLNVQPIKVVTDTLVLTLRTCQRAIARACHVMPQGIFVPHYSPLDGYASVVGCNKSANINTSENERMMS